MPPPIEKSDLSESVATSTEETLATDDNKEKSLRPRTLDQYIGQEKLKKILNITLHAAQKRGDLSSLGHILLYGEPGLGKTSCALLLAEMIGSRGHVLSAPSIDKPKDIIGILLSIREGDVLFIDEIHRLNKITEEMLYPALEDFCLDLSTGKGVTTQVTRMPLAKFIFIGATTKLGMLSAPLRDRFTQIYHMQPYSTAELGQIALRTAKILDFELSEQSAEILAKAARGTPRIVNRLCRLLRDYMLYQGADNAHQELAYQTLKIFEIDERGLDPIDRELLLTIIDKYNGGPVGLDTLAASLGQDAHTIEDFHEPFLLRQGFLERTPKGRKASLAAYRYLQRDIFSA